MGYNIDLIDASNPSEGDCSKFINRSFYNFLASYEVYGETSVLIRSGQYFGLDLLPLTKLAYTWEDLPKEEIEEKKQPVEDLLKLVAEFKEMINLDMGFIQQVDFAWEDYYARYSAIELKSMKESGLQIDPSWNEKVEMQEYFIKGQLNEDLDTFLAILSCFQVNKVKEVVITAG